MNSTVHINGDQAFVDELIRENARLSILHEADRQTIRDLRQRAASDELEARLEKAKAVYEEANQKASWLEARLRRAIADLHFVMTGGDPCDVCSVKCPMGTAGCLIGSGDCKPVWRGEQEEDDV